MKIWSLLPVVAILYGCQEKSAEERLRERPLTETSNGLDGVGTVENPMPKNLWAIQFSQAGLEVEDVMITDPFGRSMFISKGVDSKDTVVVTPVLRGWKLYEGKASAGSSAVMKRPDGKVVFEIKDEIKAVHRFDIDSIMPAIYFTAAGLDTTVPYYDCEFKIWDKVSGRSVSGSYRIHLKKK